MAMQTTRDAVRAMCGTDPTISKAQENAVLLALDGSTIEENATPIDRALTRKEVARLIGCDPHSVLGYARKGLIRGLTCGDKLGRFRRYSGASVRAFLEGRVPGVQSDSAEAGQSATKTQES